MVLSLCSCCCVEWCDGVWFGKGRTIDWCLPAQLFEHFGCAGESVSRFADGDVEDEFLDAQFAHGVCGFLGGALGFDVLPVGLLLGGLAFRLELGGDISWISGLLLRRGRRLWWW